jgi:chromosome segregation ATPase
MAKQAESEEQEAAPSTSHSALNEVVHYVALGAGPLLALIALVFAIIAISRLNPLQANIDAAEGKIKNLNSELNAAKFELKKARDTMQQEKAAREAENQKQDELSTKIIQNLTPLQKKLKISPTLEEQLQPASAVQPTANNAVSPQPTEKPHSPQVKAMLDQIKKFNEQ